MHDRRFVQPNVTPDRLLITIRWNRYKDLGRTDIESCRVLLNDR